MDHRRDALRDRFATFSTNLAAAGGIAHRAGSVGEAAGVITGLLAQPTTGVVWASTRVRDEQPELMAALEASGVELRLPTDPASVRDEPVGLAVARIGIVETGSVLLHEPRIADRSVSLMTNLLIVVCSLDALMASLDDAAGVLRDISLVGSSYATFVTGPSRTADIERQLTVGVQGPAAMHVVFVP